MAMTKTLFYDNSTWSGSITIILQNTKECDVVRKRRTFIKTVYLVGQLSLEKVVFI